MAFSPVADYEVHAITDLTPQWFHENGIRLMLLDFDNTIVAYTETVPSQAVTDWFGALKEAGVTVMVVSNSRRSHRVPDFCQPRGIPFIKHAGKPSPKSILRAMEEQGFTPGETAMAGDQTFTDVLGGNRAGVTTILVDPIYYSNPFQRIRRGLEQPFIQYGRKKRKR